MPTDRLAHQPGPHRTHEVANQPPPLEGYNFFDQNLPLVEALRREGGGWAEEKAVELGETAGSAALAWGVRANEHPPVIHTHDRYGNRLDEVEYHPDYHELMRLAISYGLHASPWRSPRPGAHVARAAMFVTLSQTEAGHGCPISMTYAAVAALRTQPDLAEEWEPRLTSLEYDPRLIPAAEKSGALCGMAMTEKQGGSDVRSNTTIARPLAGGGPGTEYSLTGHKWFCSAPMCDVFLTLAQTGEGLSCFLLPRVLPDGARNAFHIQRLKDKLGNRSNASGEIEYDGAVAWMVGEPDRGVPTIIEMVNHTRLDCVLGSTALMRGAVAQATHHAAHRPAFGKLLAEQPLMQNVLADLGVESEAATVLAVRLARSYDEAPDDEQQAHFKRLATAVAKYWICKRAPMLAAEALECLGGNGYVEDSGMPRLYREAPVNSIWEGSGNVMCLDVLRAMARNPESLETFLAEVSESAGVDPRLDAFVDRLKADLRDLSRAEPSARRIVERMALALQGSLLARHGHPAVADAYGASRLEGDRGHAFGTLPPGVDSRAIIERHRPGI